MIHPSQQDGMFRLHDVGDTKKVMVGEFEAFIERTGLMNTVIESPLWCGNPERMVQIVGTADHTPFALRMVPVTYEHGEAIPFDERRDCVNQIQFLGYPPSVTHDALGTFILSAIGQYSNGHMVLVKTKCPTLAEMFLSLGFVRISGVGDDIGQYVYSPGKTSPSAGKRIPVPVRDTPVFPDTSSFYYTELRRLFGFDLEELIRSGWTIYERGNSRFLFTLTFGTSSLFGQRAFKVNVFDCANGFFSGYHDVHLPDDSNVAISDLPARGFPSEIPPDALGYLIADDAYEPDKPDCIRTLWMNRDSLWVHPQHRRCGIGGSLVRIAGDVCQYAFRGISEMQVCVHFENPGIYHFHVRNGAERIENGLYRLAYNLDGGELPLIKIIRKKR